MFRIRLEINSIELDRVKRHWNLYFVFYTEHPDHPDQNVIAVIPRDRMINFRRPTDNTYSFRPEGKHTEGLFVLERDMPEDRSVKARLWVMHSHEAMHSIAEIMGEVNGMFGGKGVREVVRALGGDLWLTMGRTAAEIGEKFLRAMDDRSLGFVSMDEHFSPVEIKSGELQRNNKLTTGFAEISWSWKISGQDD